MKKMFVTLIMISMLGHSYLFADNNPDAYAIIQGYVQNQAGTVFFPRTQVLVFVEFNVATTWDNDPTTYHQTIYKEYILNTDNNGFFYCRIPKDTSVFLTRICPVTGQDIEGWRTEQFSAVLSNSWEILSNLQMIGHVFNGYHRLFVSAPDPITSNQIIIPLTYLNAHVNYGYAKLNQYLHDFTINQSGYNYYLNCVKPTVSANVSDGKLNFNFGLTAKRNGANIGSGNATISVTPTVTDVNGTKMLSMIWNNDFLTVTGFASNYVSDIKSIIGIKLPNTIHLAPAGINGMVTWDLENDWKGAMLYQTEFESISITSSAITINFATSLYISRGASQNHCINNNNN